MKQLHFLLLLFLPVFILLSCSGNSQSNKKNDVGSSTSNTNASSGEASFSCKIDGKDFSGKGTDQIVNAATVQAPGIIYFTLSPSFSGDISADLRAGGFGFEVPDKGTTIIRGVENPAYSIGYTPVNTKNNYACKEMTFTITSSSTSRISGTFSGTLIEPKTGRNAPVADGKFDIPYSTYSKK